MRAPREIHATRRARVPEKEETAFVERLRMLCERAGSANALAKAAGLSPSGFHRYLTGGEPSRKVLVALARAANVNLLWLATGEGAMDASEPPVRTGMETLTRVPLYDAASAEGGNGASHDRKQLRALAFCRKWLGVHGLEARDLTALTVRGNSMEPTIRNGDTVLIDLGKKEIVDGDIFLVRDARSALLKRVQRQLGGKLRLVCDNPDYPVVECKESSVEIVGRVVWRGSLL
jgi:phage repressor protein C with HTH and peptisase S24 domain